MQKFRLFYISDLPVCFHFVFLCSEYALKVTGNKGMEPAMEWLLAHTDDVIPQETAEAPAPASSADPPPATAAQPGEEAKSLKCDDCGRLFKSTMEVEFHAAKSGHSNFSESTEEKKPLTEDEKKEQLAKIEERLRIKRAEREEREKQEALDREKIRIKSGKDMIEARRKIEDQEMLKMVEQRKREKAEEKTARDRVKAQIELDRMARKAKDAGLPPNAMPNTSAPATPATAPAKVASTTPKKDHTHTRLQMRLLDGSTCVETFEAKEQLAAVRLFVQMKIGMETPIALMTSFPKKIFTEEDYETPLDALGLVPSAVLIATKPH